MKKTFYILLFTSLITSCFKLDDIAFLGSKIEEYKFDDFYNKFDFNLNDSYKIQDSNIHLFTLNSQLPSESSPTKIYALYIGNINTIAQDTVIVYTHGQSAHMDQYWQRTKLIAHTGGKNNYGVLTLDYRGFGLSEGKSSEESLYEDVRTTLRWLKGKGTPSSNVMLYGFSLGCIPNIKLCGEFNEYLPSKLMIESPIASVQNITEESIIINSSSQFFTDNEFNNADNIKLVNQPLMWLHGTNDDYVKIEQGALVYDNHTGIYKEAHRIIGAEHGDVPQSIGFNEYNAKLLRFIRR